MNKVRNIMIGYNMIRNNIIILFHYSGLHGSRVRAQALSLPKSTAVSIDILFLYVIDN
jgi:hypothetical protein